MLSLSQDSGLTEQGGEENVRSVGYCDAENKAETGCWYCDNVKRERFVRCDGFSSGELS